MPYGQEQHYEIAIPSPAMYFTRAGVTFILLMIAGYAVACYWPAFAGQLALNPTRVLHGCVWQLVTYLFVEPSGWSLVWNCSCVLVIGSALEREWRTRSFVALWFIAGVSCALIWIAVSLVISLLTGRPDHVGFGADSAVYGMLGAFGLAFRRKRFLFFFWGMEAQYVVLILVAIGLVLGIPQRITWIWVAGAGVGYLYLKVIWRLREGFSSGGRPVESARFKDLG